MILLNHLIKKGDHMDLYSEQMYFRSFSATKGTFYSDFPGHKHGASCYEFHYVIDGKGFLVTDDKRYKLSKNMVYITGPDYYHRQKTDLSDPMSEYCVFFELHSTGDDVIYEQFSKRNFWIGKSNSEIKKLFQRIYEQAELNTVYSRSALALYLQMLLLELSYKYDKKTYEMPCEVYSAVSETQQIDWLFLYRLKDISLELIASSLNLSIRQTQRVIREKYNKTFQQKKQESQLEQSKVLLSNSKLPLRKIAEECGFYSDSAFCNFFKKHTGMTPAQYKKEDRM